MPKAVRSVVVFVLVTALYAVANNLTSHLRITDELSLLYPPTGIGVAASMLFGLPAVLGVAVGTFLTRWTDNVGAEVLFALNNALEALIPWVAFRLLARKGAFRRRDLELRTPRARLAFFLSGVAANTAVSALVGNVIGHTIGSSQDGMSFIRGVVYWWVGNGTAGVLLGWPLLETALGLRRLRRGLAARKHHAAFVAKLRVPTQVSAPARRIVVGIFVVWAALMLAVFLSGVGISSAGTMFGVPIMVAAYLFGFRGGLISGSVLGWLAIALALAAPTINPDSVISTQLAAVDRVCLGILTGGLFEANRRMIRQMKTRYASLRQDLNYVAGVLTAAVESKDPYTEGHMQRVSLYSVRIARKLGLPEDEIENIRLAALLHDIGKIGVPDSILFKPEALHADELKTMRSHTEIGARIAENCSILRMAVPVIRNHQERWDGRTEGAFSGYPDGLKGEEIHLYARIAGVADAYDTMTTNRPYRKGLGRERAIAILIEERGKQFDPQVVDAFLADLEERRNKKVTTVFSISDVTEHRKRADLPRPGTPSSAEIPAAEVIRRARKIGSS